MTNPKPNPYDALDALPPEAIPAAIAFLAAKQMAAPVSVVSTTAPAPDELLNAAETARLLKTSRKYVYSHVRELGGTRLGRGPRGRLRFKRSVVLARVGR